MDRRPRDHRLRRPTAAAAGARPATAGAARGLAAAAAHADPSAPQALPERASVGRQATHLS